jgi:hypothetical protein
MLALTRTITSDESLDPENRQDDDSDDIFNIVFCDFLAEGP